MAGGGKKVCIIGGGSSGLTSARQCLYQGFQPTILERSDRIGGLWSFREEDTEGLPSVMNTTIINTSKELSAFSDYPPSKDYPNFMHNINMCKYFQSYASHFGLDKFVRLNTIVEKVCEAPDYEESGQWSVTSKNTKTGEVCEKIFDAVMICVGHHVYPHIPTFPGQENFKGEIVHTHSLKSMERFKDKRCVVVGIGNSGVDAVVDLTFVTPNVFLSTRRGSWIVRRVGYAGVPFDITFTSRITAFIKQLLPSWLFNSIYEFILNKAVCDHELYGLKPKHRFDAQHPTLNDALPNKILSGQCRIKGNIRTFTQNGILFEGDTEPTEVDAVILATGYQMKFPFLSEKVLQVKNNKVELYKMVWPPHHKHHTMAIIGLIQPIGAIFPIAEMHARWATHTFAGDRKLPSEMEMRREIHERIEKMTKRYVESPRHTVQVDYVQHMDEIAEEVGCKPELKKYLFSDPQLACAIFFGPCSSYQYRLEGPHAWPEARKTILSTMDRVRAPLNRNRSLTMGKQDNTMMHIILATAAILCIFYFLFDLIF